MKSTVTPHFVFIFIPVLVFAILLAGTSHALVSVQAATQPATTATGSPPVEQNLTLTPTPSPTSVLVSADTTGIIALAIVIVTTVLVGATLSLRRFGKKKSS